MDNNTSMDTSCYPFHQLVVQSSWLINKNLERSWDAFTKSTPGTSFDHEDQNGVLKNVSLYSPIVKVTPTEILYIIRPKSGVIKMNYSTAYEHPIAGWEIAFRCGTEIETKLESKSSKEKFKTAMHQLNIRDQDHDKFRLAQFKFKPRPEVDREESSYRDYDKIFYGLEVIDEIFEAWWSEHGQKMVTIFGYSLLTSRRITTPMGKLSFPVYSMRLGVCSGGGIPAAAWCYTNQTMPQISRLANTGSFVDNTGEHPATLCVSRTQFWNEWFLKVVASIPLHVAFRDTTTVAPQGPPWEMLTLSVGSDLAKKVDAEPWWSSERQTMIPSEYRWEIPYDDGGVTPLNFHWRRTDPGWKKSNPFGWIQTRVSNHVWISHPMRQSFALSGSHTINSRFRAVIESVEHFIEFRWAWEMEFRLRAVDDGLEILSSLKYVHWTCDDDGQSHYYATTWRLYRWFKSLLENKCKAISNMLNQSIKQQHMMHLPGEGLFLLKDPTLNKRGDLLTTLSWAGTVGAADNGGANVAAMGNEDDILEEPHLSSVQNLPKRQPLYVLDEDASPGVINTADFGDPPLNLLEADLNDLLEGIREEDRDRAMERLVATREVIRTANQEKGQAEEMSKEDGQVLAE